MQLVVQQDLPRRFEVARDAVRVIDVELGEEGLVVATAQHRSGLAVRGLRMGQEGHGPVETILDRGGFGLSDRHHALRLLELSGDAILLLLEQVEGDGPGVAMPLLEAGRWGLVDVDLDDPVVVARFLDALVDVLDKSVFTPAMARSAVTQGRYEAVWREPGSVIEVSVAGVGLEDSIPVAVLRDPADKDRGDTQGR